MMAAEWAREKELRAIQAAYPGKVQLNVSEVARYVGSNNDDTLHHFPFRKLGPRNYKITVARLAAELAGN